MMLGLLFYGRLEKEKGFDQLLTAIKKLNDKKIDFEIFIFGKGSLESQLFEIHSKNVHYFGWKPLDEIKKYLPNIDYCLMPSEFLETFGLSALNALSWGVPVIGYKKGGLEPFIFQECNLFLAKGNTTSERIVSFVEKLATKTDSERIEDKEKLVGKIRELLSEYTEDTRYKRFCELIKLSVNSTECEKSMSIKHSKFFANAHNDDKKQNSSANASKGQTKEKVLIISDFINKAGGIETYIHDVKNLLESHGHEVILWGDSLPSGFKGKWKKRIGLVLFPFNFRSSRRFMKTLKKENPDIVRFNSLLRRLGPNVVKTAGKWRREESNDTKLWMMYHDFGYFYPFPSELYHIEDCKTPLTRKNFVSAYKGNNPITKLAVLCKYYWLQPLKKTLKKEMDLHLSPSDCVTNVASDSYRISEKKCKSFPHFIQK